MRQGCCKTFTLAPTNVSGIGFTEQGGDLATVYDSDHYGQRARSLYPSGPTERYATLGNSRGGPVVQLRRLGELRSIGPSDGMRGLAGDAGSDAAGDVSADAAAAAAGAVGGGMFTPAIEAGAGAGAAAQEQADSNANWGGNWGFGGPSGSARTGGAGGSDWLTSLIGGAAQVGAAAVTGQNPFAPKPTAKSGGFLSSVPWWAYAAGGLVLVLALRRKSA
jgi:hypothetical protein